MSRLSFSVGALFLLAMLGGLSIVFAASAGEKPKDATTTTGGLLIDLMDDGINVQVDGEDEPTKYLYAKGLDKQSLIERSIFNVNRVNLKYEVDGDSRKVVAIERVVGRPRGVVIGEVLKVYNNFWVAVKPKNGPIDGYALQWPPEKYKQSHDLIKTLKSGDIVAIRYATDSERHRILEMELKPAPSK